MWPHRKTAGISGSNYDKNLWLRSEIYPALKETSLAKKMSLLFFFSLNRLSQLLFYISSLFETLSSSFYFNQCYLLSCTVDPLITAHRSSRTYTHTQSEQLSYATMLFFLVIEFILSLLYTPLFSSVSYLGQGLFVIIILTMHCQPN